ncbi:nucleosome assembly protein [Phaffia rhodozyma]|uniref:Nucleosome assembly protein n=1 Tax=Phaffia rhodozyma TaxID=264483 RepID=A0A0F7SVD0_PHARH|nr:nucleosome assembly protein [Phaffia rhodozyma]
MSSNLNIPSSRVDGAPTPANSFVGGGIVAPNSTKPTVEDVEEEDEQSAQQMLANNPALMSLVQGKLGDLVGKSSGYINSLPPAVRTRVEGLKGIQVEHSKLENKLQLEILALEKKFAKLYAPLYERRSNIIAGKAEPTSEEVAAGEAADGSDDEDEEEPENVDLGMSNDVKGIPEFWLTALRNHNGISSLITEADEEAFKALTDIQLSYLEDDLPGFKLTFVFAPNEYFTNTELVKTYFYQEEVGYQGDFVYERAEGTEINWNADKDLTKTIETKKQRNKSTGKTRIVKKTVPTDSFFSFFSPPSPPNMEDLENGDIDEAELETLDQRLELDYQVGEDLKERIIPRAIDYFTGKALEYDNDEDEDDDYDELDEDDDDEDEDEDDDAAPAAGAQNPQE